MSFHELDLNLLRVFDEVSARGSVTEAAAALGKTQSGVSTALRRLREALGDELFVRAGHVMQPTPFATQLAPRVRSALEALRVAVDEQAPFVPRDSQMVARVLSSDYAPLTLLPRLVDLLSVEAPGVAIRVRGSEGKARDLQLLGEGHAELAIGYYEADGATFHRRTLWQDELVVAVRRGHPALREQELGVEALAEHPHVMQSQVGDATGLVDAKLAEHGLRRSVIVTAPYFASVCRIAARSNAIAVVPRRIAETLREDFDLAVHPLPFEHGSFPLQLWWTDRLDGDPSHRWLRECVYRAACCA